jgi:hypothetical protein
MRLLRRLAMTCLRTNTHRQAEEDKRCLEKHEITCRGEPMCSLVFVGVRHAVLRPEITMWKLRPL